MDSQSFITATGAFLPGPAVTNDEMEDVLGRVGPNASRTRRLILRNNGIRSRHYAIDRGIATHTNAGMTASAVEAVAAHDGIEVLACGTGTPDQLLPSHASMVHGELGSPPLEIASFTGACNSGMQALKYAHLSILAGASVAVATGSERSSALLRSSSFEVESERLADLSEDGFLAFEKDFLRWMLSDGAGAVRLEPVPGEGSLSLRLDWIDMRSFAGELDVCMYVGDTKAGRTFTGYLDLPQREWLADSVFAVKQDTRLLGEHIVDKGGEALEWAARRHDLDVGSIDWFLPHLSSEFFRPRLAEALAERGHAIPADAWFTNLAEVGNVGSASPFLLLDGLLRSGRLRSGDRVLLSVPESARFSYTLAHLTAMG